MSNGFGISTAPILVPNLEGTAVPATLLYLVSCGKDQLPPHPFTFLHTVRSVTGKRGSETQRQHYAYQYYTSLSSVTKQLRGWAESRTFDVAIQAPSSRHDAEPYFSALFLAQKECRDYSASFSKAAGFKIGSAKTFEEAVHAISCSAKVWPPSGKRLLIVDDVLTTGFTAGAVLHRARKVSGFPIDPTVTIFVPVWFQGTGEPR